MTVSRQARSASAAQQSATTCWPVMEVIVKEVIGRPADEGRAEIMKPKLIKTFNDHEIGTFQGYIPRAYTWMLDVWKLG
eukprot:2697131-Prymnesium_polylepis.1